MVIEVVVVVEVDVVVVVVLVAGGWWLVEGGWWLVAGVRGANQSKRQRKAHQDNKRNKHRGSHSNHVRGFTMKIPITFEWWKAHINTPHEAAEGSP